MNNYILIILAFFYYSNSYAQEENCPEPKKKAIKYLESARLAASNQKKSLLMEAIKIDPNYLEAYDELATIADREAENAFNKGEAGGLKNSTALRISYWKKIVEILKQILRIIL
ncbi:MAG: hypothetical protein CVT95_04505 [Bacteroidetes bacterium HGW-Bacteroidetes-12]|nr:MAG: hypothetical protein CVT95_04505 [Bacteroidetes bacterium HGW-Bacteroidetes-12]